MTEDLQKVAKYWGDMAARKSQAGSSVEACTWSDSPIIQRHYIYPAISGSANAGWLHWLREKLIPEPVDHILSLGCGDGCLEREAFALHVYRRCDAIDVSGEAIAIATRKAAEAGVLERVSYQVADINTIQLQKDCYDIVFSGAALHHVENMEHVLDEVEGSLKKDGLFLLNEYVGPSRFQWTDRQLSIANQLLRLLPDKYRMEPSTKTIRENIPRLSPQEMMAVDPSEAARSADILPLMSERFNIRKIDYGGTIINLLLNDIILNFDEQKPEDMALLRTLFYLEETLIREGVLSSDFAVILAEKKTRAFSILHMANLLPPLVRFDSPEGCFSGFSQAEHGYRWTMGNSARLIFDVPGFGPKAEYLLVIESGSLDFQEVTILLNGERIGEATFLSQVPEIKTFPVRGALLKHTGNVLEFQIPGARQPGPTDPRVLGLAFRELRLNDANQTGSTAPSREFPGGLPYLRRRTTDPR